MKKDKGFTLIELLVIIVIISILAFVVTPKVNMKVMKVSLAARKVATDMRYARNLSYNKKNIHGITFKPGSYMVFENDNPVDPAKNPIKGNDYIIFMTGEYGGVTISYSDGLSNGIVKFGTLGEPMDENGGALGREVITLFSDGLSVSIIVEGRTGNIRIVKP